ncbi:hypothetical protein Ciccas_013841, partial [Cichlidogyrus casuarinus]
MTQEDKDFFLSEHNEYRNQLVAGNVDGQPQAQSMHQLQWDDLLAETAEKKAQTCVFAHDSKEDRIPAGKSDDQLYSW